MTTSREAEKSAYEHGIFSSFLDRTETDIIRSSIRAGDPLLQEPDLICAHINGTKVGFELGRLVDPNLKKALNRWEPENGEYIRTSDPSATIAKKKLKKQYAVIFPVELLLYKENPIITPDNVIIPTIKPLCYVKHKYSKVWFMGDSIELLYEREPAEI